LTDTLCFQEGSTISIGQFIAEATLFAAQLPARGYAINLAKDRYLALLGFAAALIRGHATLLHSDPAPVRLAALAARYPGAYALADFPLPATALQIFTLYRPRAAAPHHPAPVIPAGQLAAIAFTSGSTGEPSAHEKPWGAINATAFAAAERFGFRTQDGAPTNIVATVPPQHMYGFETTMVMPLHANIAIHSGASFFPGDVLKALESLPPRRLLITTPLHLRALLGDTRQPATLSGVISATAPLSPAIAEAVERDWSAPMLEIYGASEAGSIASRRSLHEPDWLPYGGISVSGNIVSIPGIGWVPLADELETGPNGRFRLLGRLADLVKLGGRRASLGELNRILTEVPGVEDGIFVAPSDIESNPAARLSAYVVAPNLTAEGILGVLREKMEAVFLPRPIVLVPALPRNALGKLPQAALKGLQGSNV